MRSILKYTLQKQRINTFQLPLGAQLVSAQEQHGDVALWIQINADIPMTMLHEFHSYHTAELIPDGLTYRATVQLHDGHTVIHIFERVFRG